VALLGTCPRADAVASLTRFDRAYLTLDEDAAGRAATEALVGALGDRAVAVPLPGVGDVGELAAVPGGRAALLGSAARAARARAA
jgi:DNA primase